MPKKSIAQQFFDIVDLAEKSRIKTRTNPNEKKVVADKIDELYKKPTTFKSGDPNNAHIQVFAPDEIHQIDTLYMPWDSSPFAKANKSKSNVKHKKRGYKYVLVVTDLYDGQTDAEPLEHKRSEDIVNAITTIYKRPKKKDRIFNKLPREIQVDAGTEFKGDFLDWIEENNIKLRTGLTNRHKQQAFVENRNRLISRILSRQMANEEMLTGEPSSQWVKNLPLVIQTINKNLKDPITEPVTDTPIDTSFNRILIPEGTKVRITLDHPESVLPGTKLYGPFREGDIRWSREIYTVKHILLKPGVPPQYLVEDSKGKSDMVARPKQELQVIKT